MKNNRNLFSFLAVGIFFVFAVASKVNKIHLNAFKYNNKIEAEEKRDVYLEKNDGTKVYGKRVVYKNGLLNKKEITMDGQEFKIADVRGYRMGNSYYGRKGNSYLKRIVHGKINVYVEFTEVTGKSYSYTRADHYYQIGEYGELKAFGSQDDIKRIVADCLLSVEMADKSSSEIKKAIKSNSNYMNDIFEIYNNDCKLVTK